MSVTSHVTAWFTMMVKKVLPSLSVVLGGAASGKSVFAENIILHSRLNPVYLATALIGDDEIKKRVDVHKLRRSDRWINLEAAFDLSPVLADRAADQAVLLDCATMWLSNQMMEGTDLAAEQARLLAALKTCAAPIVVVTNEVGQGIVPDNALARHFREAQGRLNIALAAQADLVVQVVAGLSNVLKGDLP